MADVTCVATDPARADEQCLPFEVRVSKAATRRAIAERELGKGKRFESADALFEDLGRAESRGTPARKSHT